MAFTHTKKVYIRSFIKARIRIRFRIRSQTSGSGSDQKGPDPTGAGSATLFFLYTVIFPAAPQETVGEPGSNPELLRSSLM
jgi:hypothetical protein